MGLQVLTLECEKLNDKFNTHRFFSDDTLVMEMFKHSQHGLTNDVVVYFNEDMKKLLDDNFELSAVERVLFNEALGYLVRLDTFFLESPEKAITGVAVKGNKLIVQFDLGENCLEEKRVFQLVKDLK